MDTLENMVQAVQDDLNIGDESTLYPPALIKRVLNRSKRKVEGAYPWPELHDAKKTSTQADQEYYDYPLRWRSNSVWKIEVDGDRYGEDPDGSPLSFDDYLNWKEDNPDSTDKKWANQWRRFFIWPVPAAVGDNNIVIWGVKVTSDLGDGDTTVFSYSTPEANEAMVLEAVAILKSKAEKERSAEFRSTEAKKLLATAWDKIAKEQNKYEKNQPFFQVNDMFSTGNSKDLRGRFDI